MTAPEVVIVGGGVMGVATAAALAERGARVTLLERASVAHEWASSHGLSRAIRHEYGAAVIYSAMVARSLALWRDLAAAAGRDLYVETGVLTLGDRADGHTLAGLATMRAAGLPVTEISHADCRQRFPIFEPAEFDAITYNAAGGFLRASECVLALAARARRLGATIREGVAVARVVPAGAGGRVILADGASLRADRVVVTAGPWTRTVLPDLALPIRPTRQQVAYFAGLPAARFGVGACPVFLARMDFYGFPLTESGWFKVGRHTFGPTVNPDAPYSPDMAEVAATRAFLRRVIPTAAEAPLAAVDRCMYDVTADEDFILDRHPGGPGVIIGSGFSGHGFKFGILIGRLLADLALDTPPEFPLDGFRLGRASLGGTSLGSA